MLDVSLDAGIKELDFWEMTIAELDRAIQSFNRNYRRAAQERASYDYVLASVLSKNISVILSGKGQAPTIEEAYPDLFTDLIEEQKQKIEEQKANLSALRFKQFAQSYNENFKNKEVHKAINE